MDMWGAHRKAVESMYDGECSVYEYKKARDGATKLSNTREVLVAEGIPCRLSFSSAPATEGGEAAGQRQEVKLFLAPEVVVNPGSKIVVTQNQREGCYACSGVPAVYPTHQEIILELFERWA